MSSSSGYPRTRILFGSIRVIAVRHSVGDAAVSLRRGVRHVVRLVTVFRAASLAVVMRGGRRGVARRLGMAVSYVNGEATMHDWVSRSLMVQPLRRS